MLEHGVEPLRDLVDWLVAATITPPPRPIPSLVEDVDRPVDPDLDPEPVATVDVDVRDDTAVEAQLPERDPERRRVWG